MHFRTLLACLPATIFKSYRPYLFIVTVIGLCLLNERSLPRTYSSVWAGASQENLLQDSFDQSNSLILGGAWKELGEVNSEFTAANGTLVGPGFIERYNGALAFHYIPHSQRDRYNSANGRPAVYAPLSKKISLFPATFSFTLSPHQDGRISHFIGLMSASGGFSQIVDIPGSPALSRYIPVNGIFLAIGRSSNSYSNSFVNIVRQDNGIATTLAGKNLGFQFQYGTSYSFKVTFNQDLSINVEIVDRSSNMKDVVVAGPVIASFPLDQVFITDVQAGISYDTQGNRGDFRLGFDNLVVSQPTPRCLLGCNATVPKEGVAGSAVSVSAAYSGADCHGTTVSDWDFGDGKAHSSGIATSHIYSMPGTYKWTLTVINSDNRAMPCITTGSIKIAASTLVKEGWASQTGFRYAETTFQKNLIASVKNLSGQTSGQSVPRTDVLGGDWFVDTDGGDGQRVRSGIQLYDKWYRAKGNTTRPQIRSQMIKKMDTLQSDSFLLTEPQRAATADRIMEQYDGRAKSGPVILPANDRETLVFLGIRKQCREFVSTWVLSNKGKSRTYFSGKVNDTASYRPGMGLYKSDVHAMIITDIYWDKNGSPTKFLVAEANYGTGWMNPSGMVPWQRTVKVGAREITTPSAYFSGCYVVTFE